ncbi:Os09g0482761, partial [Oryza sativa Japonica Group]
SSPQEHQATSQCHHQAIDDAGADAARGARRVRLAAAGARLAGRRAGREVGRPGHRRRGGRRRQRRVLAEDLHGQEHLVERVHRHGPRGVHAARDLGPGPHRLHGDGAHVVGEVQRVRRAGERVHRVELAEVLELGQGVELGERVVQQQRLELVAGEVGKGGLLDGGERRVLGDEDGDALLGLVRLALERLDDVRLLQVVEERVERPGHAEELGEVDVVRRRRRRRSQARWKRHRRRRRRRALLLSQCR